MRVLSAIENSGFYWNASIFPQFQVPAIELVTSFMKNLSLSLCIRHCTYLHSKTALNRFLNKLFPSILPLSYTYYKYYLPVVLAFAVPFFRIVLCWWYVCFNVHFYPLHHQHSLGTMLVKGKVSKVLFTKRVTSWVSYHLKS